MLESYLPPHSIELEQSILATCFLRSDDDLFTLHPDVFYRSAHSRIFKACKKVYEIQKPVDAVMVADELKGKKELKEVGGISYLSKIMDFPPVIDIDYSIKKITGYHNLRRMIEIANSISKASLDCSPDDVETLIDKYQQEFFSLSSKKVDNLKPISECIAEAIENAELIYKQKGITGIPSGFEMLDKITCGFQKSDLILLAGRPGMGKTAFALNCAVHEGAKYCVDFYSLEMSRLQSTNRILSLKSGINGMKFRSGRFGIDDWQQILSASEDLSKRKIFIDDSPTSTYQDIQRKARKNKVKHNTDIIWIDYLSFVSGDRNMSTVKEIESITRGLKVLAKEIDVAVVLLCQLNRQCEQRPNKRPKLSDLRDSGALEQDADLVLFLYRDEVYHENSKYQGLAEINVAKHRNGPVGTIKLVWNRKTTKFNNLAKIDM